MAIFDAGFQRLKKMNTLKMILVSTLITIASGLVLSYFYESNKPKIAEQQLKVSKDKILTVMPEARNYRKLDLDDNVILFDK